MEDLLHNRSFVQVIREEDGELEKRGEPLGLSFC
jgi:hypothetical protein